MSYEIHFSAPGEEPDHLFLGTGQDWADFGEWVNGLDGDGFPNLKALVADGTTTDTMALREQIEAALEANEPAIVSVADTAAEIVKLIGVGDANETATIDDGVNGEADDSEEEDDPESE